MTVTLAQAKAQLRVTHSDEDTYITDLIARATAWIERYTAKNIAEAEVVDTFNEFGDFLQLSRGPFVSLTSLGYVADGEAATIATGDVFVQDGRIYAPTTGWPAVDDHSTITVTYQAGYTTTPPELDHAMLLLIAHWYQNREAVSVSGVITPRELPFAIEALAGPFRTPTIA